MKVNVNIAVVNTGFILLQGPGTRLKRAGGGNSL